MLLIRSTVSSKLIVAFCLLILNLTISCQLLFAQTEIRLAPGIGFQATQSFVTDDLNSGNGFGAYNFDFSPTYQVSLQALVRRDWGFFTGVKTFAPTVGFKYGSAGYVINKNLDANCTSLSFGFEKRISTHTWFRITPGKGIIGRSADLQTKGGGEHYLLLFRLKLIGGVSHDWVANFPGTQTLRSTNTSTFVGLGIQFFGNGKDRLQVSFIYSQGLRQISEWAVDYVDGGTNYSGTVGSKGSFFATQVAYPFRLFGSLTGKRD